MHRALLVFGIHDHREHCRAVRVHRDRDRIPEFFDLAQSEPRYLAADHRLAAHLREVGDDLGRVLDWAAPGEPAVLGGLSFGGLASLHTALSEPSRARALLLVDSGPGFKNPQALEGWKAQTERTASFLENKGPRAFVEKREPRWNPDPNARIENDS